MSIRGYILDLSLDLSLDLGLDPDLDLKIRTELPPAQVRLFSRRSHSINRFSPNAAPRTLRFSMRMLPLDGSLGSDDEGGPAQVSVICGSTNRQGGAAAAAASVSASPPKAGGGGGGLWRSVGPTDYYSPQHRISVENSVRILHAQGTVLSPRIDC